MVHADELQTALYQLARLALTGRRQDVLALLRRLARRLKTAHPDLAAEIDSLLSESPTQQSPVRSVAADTVPVDADSRLHLARYDYPVVVDTEPILSPVAKQRLEQVVAEREREQDLQKAGLIPTRSILFTGPPGVGKTLSARWLAHRLSRPLFTLDLSAVMSSYLGRTGTNVRNVLDYAKELPCVLLLDELDAVAKRRDDSADVGELKRLVTVLLQEIDDWPPTGILVAATNHPDLLDPAVWRRFDMVIQFELPNDEQVRQTVERFFESHEITPVMLHPLATALRGLSYSVIERELLRARRESIISGTPLEDSLAHVVKEHAVNLEHANRIELAGQLRALGLSERKVSELTGVHRNTIHKTSRGRPRAQSKEQPDG